MLLTCGWDVGVEVGRETTTGTGCWNLLWGVTRPELPTVGLLTGVVEPPMPP